MHSHVLLGLACIKVQPVSRLGAVTWPPDAHGWRHHASSERQLLGLVAPESIQVQSVKLQRAHLMRCTRLVSHRLLRATVGAPSSGRTALKAGEELKARACCQLAVRGSTLQLREPPRRLSAPASTIFAVKFCVWVQALGLS